MNPLRILPTRRQATAPPDPTEAGCWTGDALPAERLHRLRANVARLADRLDARAQDQLDAVDAALQDHAAAGGRRALATLREELALLETVWALETDLAADPAAAPGPAPPLTFRVGTMALAAWHKALMPPERELALSGLEIGPGEYTIDQAVRLGGRASAVTVEPDPTSVYQALTRFDGFGYRLRAYAHSQPGTGPEATRPSARDLATQRGLERHYRAIGLIFSEDGYLRAYSDRLPFRLAIFGTNWEVIDATQHLYRLHLS